MFGSALCSYCYYHYCCCDYEHGYERLALALALRRRLLPATTTTTSTVITTAIVLILVVITKYLTTRYLLPIHICIRMYRPNSMATYICGFDNKRAERQGQQRRQGQAGLANLFSVGFVRLPGYHSIQPCCN